MKVLNEVLIRKTVKTNFINEAATIPPPCHSSRIWSQRLWQSGSYMISWTNEQEEEGLFRSEKQRTTENTMPRAQSARAYSELNSKSSSQVCTWCAPTHTSITSCKRKNGKSVKVSAFVFSTQNNTGSFTMSFQHYFPGRSNAHSVRCCTCNVFRWFQKKYYIFTKYKPAFSDYWTILDFDITQQEYFLTEVICLYFF